MEAKACLSLPPRQRGNCASRSSHRALLEPPKLNLTSVPSLLPPACCRLAASLRCFFANPSLVFRCSPHLSPLICFTALLLDSLNPPALPHISPDSSTPIPPPKPLVQRKMLAETPEDTYRKYRTKPRIKTKETQIIGNGAI